MESSLVLGILCLLVALYYYVCVERICCDVYCTEHVYMFFFILSCLFFGKWFCFKL